MTENPLSRTPLSDVLSELENIASLAFENAKPIPASVNHSLDFYDHERKSIFMKEWILVCREDEIPSHGNYLTHQIAGVSIYVIRQSDGKISAFINACAHRRACLLDKEKGTSKRITCPYHAWSYDTNGKLIKAPFMEMEAGFDPDNHPLESLHCTQWEGFVYVTLAEQPETDLCDVLKPLSDNVVGKFDMGCYKTIIRDTMEWNGNWKNLIENFTESYHVPIAHQKTFAKHDKPLGEYVCGEDSDYYCYHMAVQEADSGLGAAHPDNHRLQGEWRRMMVDFCIFPCHLITLLPDYVWYISVQPDGVNRFKAHWGVAVPPEVLESAQNEGFDQWFSELRSFMDIANEEDRILVEALHKGSASNRLPVGKYHPIEKNLWQFTRYLSNICSS